MCMIAHRPIGPKGRGSNIPNAVIDTAMTRHSDGFGVAWRDGRKLRHAKFGPQERHEFRTLLKKLDSDRSVEYVAHFRMATHGKACKELSHPFSYIDPEEGEVLVFHNGVINVPTPTDGSDSDTSVFVRGILRNLPSGWWRNEAIRYLVDDFIGWSKLVLMTRKETINLHFDKGDEDGGLWYSSNHKPTPTYTVKTSPVTASSYAVTYGWDDDDEEWKQEWVKLDSGAWVKREDAAKFLPETTTPESNTAVFRHAGHGITPLQSFDFTLDSDYENSVVCDTCGTAGDVYVVGGRAYIDIPHKDDERTFDEAYNEYEDGLIGVPSGSRALVVVK